MANKQALSKALDEWNSCDAEARRLERRIHDAWARRDTAMIEVVRCIKDMVDPPIQYKEWKH